MPKLFISHASEDKQRITPFLRKLLADQVLAAMNVEIWVDRPRDFAFDLGDEPRISGIRYGLQWDAAIQNALNDSACVLGFWSSNAVSTERKTILHDELIFAQTSRKLVPALLDSLDIAPLPSGRLTEIGQAIDLSVDDGARFCDVVTEIVNRLRIQSSLEVGAESQYQLEVSSSGSSGIDRDAILLEILKSVTGLPLVVAQSIVESFGADAKEKSLGEIEGILRRKALEYQTLKDELATLAPSAPAVKGFRDSALLQMELGDFDAAHQTLLAARAIDQTSSRAAETILHSRQRSEAETLLAIARFAAIRNRYSEAVSTLIEVRGLIHGREPNMELQALSLAAEYINSEYRDFGGNGIAAGNLEIFNQILIPASDSLPKAAKTRIREQLADIYRTLGYRMASKKILREALRLYCTILSNIEEFGDADFRLKCHVSLGDIVCELGLNRGSLRQAKLGVELMRRGMDLELNSASRPSQASALVNLGTAQANTALISNAASDYLTALDSYNAAVSAIEGTDEQLLRYRAFWGQAIALTALGQQRGEIELLDRAEAACNSALAFIRFDRFPVDWATIIQNRGNARLERGVLEAGVESLLLAIEDYQLSLTVRSKRSFALGYAKTKGNLGIAKRIAGERQADISLCQSARADLDDAIGVLQTENCAHLQRYYSSERQNVSAAIERLMT